MQTYFRLYFAKNVMLFFFSKIGVTMTLHTRTQESYGRFYLQSSQSIHTRCIARGCGDGGGGGGGLCLGGWRLMIGSIQQS